MKFRNREQPISKLYKNRSNLFSYYDDFSNILSTIISTIDTMEQRMSDKTTGRMREREAQDMISFTYDMTKTFEKLQSVHPDISYVFLKANFVNR